MRRRRGGIAGIPLEESRDGGMGIHLALLSLPGDVKISYPKCASCHLV